jgi:hypothetical protein
MYLRNQMRERDSCLEWIADDVAQISVALEPLAKLRWGRVVLWVNENHCAQLFGSSLKWVEF